MYYIVNHTTRFLYSQPVTESVMEIRMKPCSEGPQRCLSFDLETQPKTRASEYFDPEANSVYHFDILPAHRRLEIKTRAIVEIAAHSPAAATAVLEASAWAVLDERQRRGCDWFFRNASQFIQFTPLLQAFALEIGAVRRADPLTVLREINQTIFGLFDYMPQTTTVDSPLDEVLTTRQGVCQDFSHLMVALVRWLGIPCRYVSGYLYHRRDDEDRSAQDASHAWVEAWLPELGWVGFDPTNNLLAGERHIRSAIGRDYADVPPTRGVFTGNAKSELDVAVQVLLTEEPPTQPEPVVPSAWAALTEEEMNIQMQQVQQQ
jgi:transglutaminase-like putative cysteine protease